MFIFIRLQKQNEAFELYCVMVKTSLKGAVLIRTL